MFLPGDRLDTKPIACNIPESGIYWIKRAHVVRKYGGQLGGELELTSEYWIIQEWELIQLEGDTIYHFGDDQTSSWEDYYNVTVEVSEEILDPD